MYKNFWIFTLVVLFSTPLSAQSSLSTFSGSVIDSDSGEPLEFVNILLLTTDSVYIDGTMSDASGKFHMANLIPQKAIVKISFIGYQTLFEEINIDNSNTKTFDFKMVRNDQILNEIIVKGARPQYKMNNGNLITNVENTLLSTIGNANEVLGQIPGVSVDDKNIIVLGKGAPMIYINNRKIYDINELTQLQSSDIVSIEVLRNPGAKYDAQSQSVIIIKTKKKLDGLSFNLLSRTWYKEHPEAYEGINITYSADKLNTFLSYNYGHSRERMDTKANYYIYSDTIWNQYIDMSTVFQQNDHNVSAGVDYSFTSKQIMGMEYRGSFSWDKDNSIGNEDFLINHFLEENIVAKTLKKDKTRNHLLNLFYDGSIGDKLNVRFDMDYIDKKSPSYQLTNEESTIVANSALIDIESNANFNLLATKLTGTYKIGESSRVELGSEYSNIHGDGFYREDGNVNSSSNVYENKEEKIAAFIGYTTFIKGWELGVGLRFEHSHEKTTIDSIVKTNRDYNDIYPNLNLSKRLGNVSVSLSGNIRTRRPSFSQLNSNDLYVNRFLTQKGNPYLQKEDYYEISSNILYKIFSVNIGYSYIKNPISFNILQNGSSQANSILTFTNYSMSQQISAIASVNHKIGLWQPKLTMGIIKPFFSSFYKNKIQDYDEVDFSINFSNDLVLPNNFIFSLYFLYQNDYYTYSTKWKGYTILNSRLRKSVLHDKLRFNLYINDIFNSKEEGNEIKVNIYNFAVSKKRETQYVSFSVQFLFNTSNKQYKGKNVSDDDINRL